MLAKTALQTVAFTLVLSSCAIFEEPIEDNPGAVPSGIPVSNAPPPTGGSNTVSASTPPPAASQTATTRLPVYFTVTTFDELPANFSQIAFVHLTNLGASRNTTRELAVCKSVMKKYPVTPAEQIPADAALLVWPVTDASGSNICLEMLTRYDPVDIRQATAAKVNELAAGPFLLARGGSSDQRMIYDMSNIPAARLPATFDNWTQLFAITPDRWPEYRYAR